MTTNDVTLLTHSHVFLGEQHAKSERKTWAVIALCAAMMTAEIVGGLYFGSIALVADGLHMSTHAGALLLAALAYSFARKYAADSRFTFGTGKLGDLAGFSSAIILAMIALLIGYEAVSRLFAPVPINFKEAIPIAFLGLTVNVASVWLLSGHDHGHNHGHSHGHSHGHDHAHDDEALTFDTAAGTMQLSVFEDDHAPVFRVAAVNGTLPEAAALRLATTRPDGSVQRYAFASHGAYLQSVEEIPEPHAFVAAVQLDGAEQRFAFEEHGHEAGGKAHRDNNMRAAVIHVVADAAVSVLVIIGLSLAWAFGWLWMDPLAGIVGACVIASWSYGLVRDTAAILLDMNPDRELTAKVRSAIEAEGDRLADLHVWRLGPGHLGAIVSVMTRSDRTADFYRAKLARFRSLSHVTVEVH
jgi:cation diffusion facilitator family transporter